MATIREAPEVRARSASVVAGLLALLASPTVLAHSSGLSRGDYAIHAGDLEMTAVFSRLELARAVPALADDDAPPDQGFRPSTRLALARWVEAGYRVTAGGAACTTRAASIEPAEEDGVRVVLGFACGGGGANVRVDASLLATLAPGHRHVVHVAAEGTSRDFVLRAEQPMFEIDRSPLGRSDREGEGTARARAASERFGSLFLMGVEHILTGYDHLVFLVGLLLVQGPLRSLVVAVTAFTISHSLTLSLATLGVAAPSPRLIEPLIALSIAYVGIENWFVSSAAGRWRLTFVFGLIHGFGFAGALREIALPRAELPGALLAFNLGVETGQLAVLGLVLPLLLFARARGWLSPWRAKLLSLPVAVAGLTWLCARLVRP